MKMSRLALSLFCGAALLLCAVRATPLEETDASSTTTTTTTTSSSSSSSSESTTTKAATEIATATGATDATTASGAARKPKYLTADNVPVCKQSNADLGDCVQRIFEIILPRLKHGNPELGFPPLDPFTLNRTTLQATYGPVTGRITMRDGLIYGLSDMVYKKVELKFVGEQLKAVVRSFVPRLRVAGRYKADVKVNNAHLRPRGMFNLTLVDVQLTTISDSVFEERDGHRFVRLLNFDAHPTIGDMKINLTGIFEDPELNEVVVNFLNQYWRELYTALLPETRNYWAPLVLRAVNEALTVVPFDYFVKNE